MFNFIKNKLASFFSKTTIDQQALTELEKILIEADIGVATTKKILTTLKARESVSGSDIQEVLKQELLERAQQYHYTKTNNVFLCVGINGSGKTTFVGKLANFYTKMSKRVLLVAADTFRAAAPEQLREWATSAGADIFMGKQDQDPSSVIFAGCQKYITENYDILIIDTAGRLQTKINLMNELEKMRRTLARQLPEHSVTTLLTIDAMLGQNSLEQAKLFNECTPLDGIVLTKYDGTGKGGIVFPILETLHVPIAYISYGEKIEQFKPFNAHEFISDLIKN